MMSINTLYMTISGGVDWGDVCKPLTDIHPVMGFLFAMYIAFGVLCVLNIVTGVFVENANKITSNDEDQMIMEELNQRKIWISEVKALFETADQDGSGVLDW